MSMQETDTASRTADRPCSRTALHHLAFLNDKCRRLVRPYNRSGDPVRFESRYKRLRHPGSSDRYTYIPAFAKRSAENEHNCSARLQACVENTSITCSSRWLTSFIVRTPTRAVLGLCGIGAVLCAYNAEARIARSPLISEHASGVRNAARRARRILAPG